MSEQPISINLVIADRPYPLKIKASEEELVRRAGKIINEKVREFQSQYAAKDKQDYLAMVALFFAVEKLQESEKLNETEKSIGQISEQIIKKLEDIGGKPTP